MDTTFGKFDFIFIFFFLIKSFKQKLHSIYPQARRFFDQGFKSNIQFNWEVSVKKDQGQSEQEFN